MDKIIYRPIGVIHSPFKEPKGTPIQSSTAKGIKGEIEIFPEYVDGLQDVEGFSHIILVYHFHLAKKSSLKAKPFMDNKPHGIFSIRGPSRPNPIGISIVRLIKVEKNILYVQDLDIVDGTPLLDIKPYVPEFDSAEAIRIGWLKGKINKMSKTKDDGRFSQKE
jgi:tRNA-Thr(GGU) m(6)t(6)A37 methyltransferase TsaA